MTSLGAVRRDGNTDAFLDATARGEFLLRRCIHCQHVGGPQETQCPACGSIETEWVRAGGGARVVSWSVVHARNAAPTITVIAEFDEGPWWWSQVVDADPAELAAGRRLRVAFEEAEGGETLPVFRLA
jgi:uncharacterized OB-fold protein